MGVTWYNQAILTNIKHWNNAPTTTAFAHPHAEENEDLLKASDIWVSKTKNVLCSIYLYLPILHKVGGIVTKVSSRRELLSLLFLKW